MHGLREIIRLYLKGLHEAADKDKYRQDMADFIKNWPGSKVSLQPAQSSPRQLFGEDLDD